MSRSRPFCGHTSAAPQPSAGAKRQEKNRTGAVEIVGQTIRRNVCDRPKPQNFNLKIRPRHQVSLQSFLLTEILVVLGTSTAKQLTDFSRWCRFNASASEESSLRSAIKMINLNTELQPVCVIWRRVRRGTENVVDAKLQAYQFYGCKVSVHCFGQPSLPNLLSHRAINNILVLVKVTHNVRERRFL